ncbi:MAG TPA: Sua5/YciO/YrdC/YwlC family protein [Burkholderiales bacterium]
MRLYDYEADARRAFGIIADGGIAVVPMHVGYAIVGGTSAAVRKIFAAKRRQPSKLNAITGSPELHRDLHVIDERARTIVDAVTNKYDLPLGTVAPCRLDHPMLKKLDRDVLEQTLNEGTIAMLMGGGPFLEALGRLSWENNVAVVGSSANISLQGTKFRVEDIEREVLDVADVVIDYGLMRWACYGKSSTMLDLRDWRVVRRGACFDLIQDLLERHFGIRLAA